MENIRQKIVSVLMLLGVILFLFRCGSGDTDDNTQKEVVSEVVEHEEVTVTENNHTIVPDETDKIEKVEHHVVQTVKSHHDKTLFVKSDEFIAQQKIEAEKMALLATQREAEEHARAEEQARLHAAEKAKAAMLASEKTKALELEKMAAIKAHADKKFAEEAEALKLAQERTRLEQEKSNHVVNIRSMEEAMAVITREKEALNKGNDELKSSKERLLATIAEWEQKAKEAAANEKKMKVAAAAAALVATQQAVANATSNDEEKLSALTTKFKETEKKLLDEKKLLEEENANMLASKEALLVKIEEWEQKSLQSQTSEQNELEKLKEANIALEMQNTDMNATMIASQEGLLAKIAEWEQKAKDAESESTKLKAATAAAALVATQQTIANATSESTANTEKIKADFQAKIEEWEQKALAAEEKAAKDKKLLEEENANMIAAKEALLVKIEEWEQKALQSQTSEQSALEKLKEANIALEMQNTDMNATMVASQEGLLAKIAEWEQKAKDAESESAKLKETTAAAALVAEEKATRERLLEEENADMIAAKEALLAKIAEWEQKAKDAESESTKLKAVTAAAALVATQQAVANAQSEDAEKLAALKAEYEASLKALSDEKATLQANIEKNIAEKKALEATNAEMTSSKVALLTKIAEWEQKAKIVEEEVNRKKSAVTQALVDAKDKLYNTLAMTKIEFKYGSAMLTGNSEELLNSVSQIMHEHPEFTYDIQGHTDAHGNEDYNVKLSTSRAEKVKEYLINKGVSSTSLTAKGFGSSMPIADNTTNEGRLKNRRVVIKIVE